MTLAGAIRKTLRDMVPSECAVSVWEAGDVCPDLMPGEEEAVERAVERRRTEFARGRACARNALAELGCPPRAIPVGPSREPLWPEGFVGAITHCSGVVGAVAARHRDVPGLGIDVEVVAPLSTGVSRLVLHPSEAERARRTDVPEVAFFSAKEAVHKALFPMTGVWMDHLDVEVVFVSDDPGGFRVRAAVEAEATTPRLADVRGRLDVTRGYVVSVAFVEP